MKILSVVAVVFFLARLVVIAEVDSYLVPSHKNVIYGMNHGTALLMDVYQPEQPNGYGVVFIMGTGFTAYGEYNDVPLKELDVDLHKRKVFPNFMGQSHQLFTPLFEKGFTIFSINHRLAPEYHLPTQIRDVQRAVQFIRHHAREYGIKADRIGGLGHSSGATMITFLGVLDDVADQAHFDPVMRESSRLQAVVPVSGVHDFLAASSNPYARGFLAGVLGKMITWQPEGHPVYATYRNSSPVAYVSPDDAAMLIMHGTDDEVVKISQSEALANRMEEGGCDYEYIALEGATHGALTKPLEIEPGEYLAVWMEKNLVEK